MASQPAKTVVRTVKPFLSVDKNECKRRVIALYKAWYRAIPSTIVTFHLPITNVKAKAKLKEEFMKHKNLTDLRVIDLLVVKGQMELRETVSRHKQTCHVMYFLKDTSLPKPTSFLSKFLAGNDYH